jgi:enamine deaminase RidA (YjgF/YER057c/UK114 family)
MEEKTLGGLIMGRQNINLHEELYKRKEYTWSDAVRKGKILAISGLVATDENHRTQYPGDLKAQMRVIYTQLQKILERAGGSFDDVIKTVDYITPQGLSQYAETAEIRREYFKGNYPAATGIVVNRLLREDWLIEIEALAVLD